MKNSVRRISSLVLAIAMLCTFLSFTALADDGKVYKVRFGNTTAPSDILNVSFEQMADKIRERTNGRLDITVYPSGQLGTLRTMTEGLQNGILEMSTNSAGGLAGFLPLMGVLELPYLYNSHQQVYEVVDGPIGQELDKKFLETTGIRILGYWENMLRQTTNNVRPINKHEDFKGLKLRVPETKTVMDTIAALSAIPTPMAFGEVYTGLSQGTIDGQENPGTIIDSAKLYEVQKYLSLTAHIYSPVVVMIDDIYYQALPEDLRTVLDEEVKNFQEVCRSEAERLDAELLESLKDKMEVNEVDTTGFREIVQPAYANLIATVGQEATDYIARIEEITNK